MKKFIAVLLCALMILSSLCVGGFAADESTTVDKIVESIGFEEALKDFNADSTKIPDEYLDGSNDYDIEELVNSGALDNVNMLGLSVDFLYNSTEPLFWKTLSIERNDLALVEGNLNMYLLGIIKKQIGSVGDVKLYTAENATKITNFIGRLINPGFVDVELKGDEYCNQTGFYTGIAKESGLANVIQLNWCNQPRINFKPLLYVLGFNFSDEVMLGASKIYNGTNVARTLIKGVIETVQTNGPLKYILSVVSNMAKTYSMYMYEPLVALFNGAITTGKIKAEDLSTLKGLFNYISNGCDPTDTEHLQFISVPSYRFALATSVNGSASKSTTDTTEMFLYSLLYLNLVGKNKSNASVIEKIKQEISSSAVLEEKEKENLRIIIDGIFLGDLEQMTGIMADITTDNLHQAKENILQNLIKMLTSFFTNFANLIQKMIDSLKNFGNF